MHQLKFGDSVARIRKMAANSGGAISASPAPTLTPLQELYLEAFSELSTERQIGMAEGPIPWSSIMRYADRYRFDAADLSAIIRLVDNAYLKHRNKKASSGSS